MSATVTTMRPRLRLIDCARRAEREGKTLQYRRGEGVTERRCDVCHQIIKYGMCDCTKPAA